jgi:hypothetical protein
MKKIFLVATIILFCMQITSAQNNEKKVLRHVVLFGWKAGTDTNAINKIVSSFKALPSKIDLIKGLEYGTNNSPENLNNGLTHCFLLTFKTEADRNAYLIHPAHKQFGAALKPKPDYITVLDYWVEK